MSQALNWDIIFLPLRLFSHWAHADSSFVGAIVVSNPDMYHTNVLMHHTMVLLVHLTKGQMLDVWGDIQQMSTLGWRWHSYAEKSSPQPGMKSWTGKDITGGIRATILVHTDWNKRSFQSNANPVRRIKYMRWLLSELAMCANSKCMLGYMGLCRIIRDTHVPCLQAQDHFQIES